MASTPRNVGTMRNKTLLTVACCILSIFLAHHANAFPQVRRRSTSFPSQHRGISVQVRLSNNSNGIDNESVNSKHVTNRRELFQRSFYSLGIALTASTANSARGNAVGLPNILLSADADRGVKGMPAPIKKSSGLGYKIRSVSKVMVRLAHVTKLLGHAKDASKFIHFLFFQRMNSKEI